MDKTTVTPSAPVYPALPVPPSPPYEYRYQPFNMDQFQIGIRVMADYAGNVSNTTIYATVIETQPDSNTNSKIGRFKLHWDAAATFLDTWFLPQDLVRVRHIVIPCSSVI
jgi:hypothetical protein